MTTTTRNSPPSSSSVSDMTSKTRPAPRRSVLWAGRCCAGRTRSPPGTKVTSRTGRPKRTTVIKRIKRVVFGMTRFRNFSVQVLLYAGKPNWDLLATITPR